MYMLALDVMGCILASVLFAQMIARGLNSYTMYKHWHCLCKTYIPVSTLQAPITYAELHIFHGQEFFDSILGQLPAQPRVFNAAKRCNLRADANAIAPNDAVFQLLGNLPGPRQVLQMASRN